MSILIKGMDMPKTGRYFIAVDSTDGKDKTVISVMSEFERGGKTRPLLAVHEAVPVPPHGRLIDERDILKNQHDVILKNGAKHRCFDTTLLSEIPTIIPAEE